MPVININNDDIRLNSSSSDKVVVNGNLGIGTTSPAYKLDVNGGDIRINKSDARLLIGWQLGSGGIQIEGGAGTASTLYFKSDRFRFYTDSALEIVSLTQAGNVGIGTTSPGTKLHIVGGNDNTLTIDNDGSTYTSAFWRNNNNNRAQIYFQNGAKEFGIGTLDASGYLAFQTGVASERMRITSDGNVGIGTTAPSGKLHVYGGSFITDLDATYHQGILNEYVSTYVTRTKFGRWNTSSNLEIYYDIAGTEEARITRNYSVASLKFNRVGTTDMIINGSGNVGIGTTAPSKKLHIYESGAKDAELLITSTYADGYDAQITLENTYTGGRIYELLSTNDSRGTIGGGKFAINDKTAGDSAARLVIDSSGNVGIGTTSPIAKLTLPLEEETNYKIAFKSAGTTHAGISTVDQSGAGLYIGANSFVNASGILTYSDSAYPSSGIYMDGWNTDSMIFYTAASGAPSERMRITSSGNVGIGTTSPYQKLHVAGNLYVSGDRSNSYLRRVPTEGAPQDGTYNGYILLAKAYTTGFVDASYVLGTLYIRRGTSSSGHNVDVYQVASSTGYNNEILSVNIISKTSSRFIQTCKVTYGGVVYHAIKTSSSGGQPSTEITFQGVLVDSPLIMTDGSYVSGEIAFGNLGYVIESSNGNVGIGTTSPAYRLDVAGGDARFVAAASTDALVRIIAANYATEYNARLFLGENDTNGMTIEYDGSNNVGFIGMNSSTDPTGAYSKRIRMSRDGSEVSFPAGNVGIGTTSPARKLDVAGSVQLSYSDPVLTLYDTGATSYGTTNARIEFNNSYATVGYIEQTGEALRVASTGSVSSVSLFTNGSDRLFVNSSGNVGIGTTNPTHLLSLNRATEAAAYQLNINNAGGISDGNFTGIRFSQESNAATELGNIKLHYHTDGSTDLSFGTRYDTSAIFIKNGGNVGIGTTSPTDTLNYGKALDIQSSTGAAVYLRDSDATSVYGILAYDGGATNRTTIGGIGASNYVRFVSAGSEAMRITSSGNVGIGTTNPTSKLHVVDGTNTVVTIQAAEQPSVQLNTTDGLANVELFNSYGNVGLVGYTTSTNYIMYHYGGGGVLANQFTYFQTGGSERMRITGAGNVGIGTTSPAKKLHVYNSSPNQGLRASNLDGVNMDVLSGANGGIVGTNSNHPLSLYTNSTEKVIITASGNVGINTAAPTNKLHVVGVPRFDAEDAGPTATTAAVTQDKYIGFNSAVLTDPNVWLRVNISGAEYLIPAYQE